MAIENEIERFLSVLRRSGLLPEGREEAVLAELANQGVHPTDARSLAGELVRHTILTAWQAEMLLQGKHRGFHLGPYVILQTLGNGSMGSVFLAQHVLMQRRCAIKVLPSKSREDRDLLDRFQLEARVVAALDHPNIVRAYDFNKDTSTGSEVYYLVMEYVEGQDLQRMVTKEGPLECRHAADLIRQAAVGLAHAHEAGFVHRDIKPANLLVDGKGILKILDLGLARLSRDSRFASPGGPLLSGTPDYIAPEQIGDSPHLDGRADIYSLGLTFYFLLVGRRPFIRNTLSEILRAHQTEQPQPINETRPDVPFELKSIIETMTAKAPEQRYKTAGNVAAALQAWLGNSAGGQPSRLSAIMSAVARSKQRGTGDAADATPPVTASKDLELAPLEELPSQPTVAMKSTAASTHRSRTGEKDVQPGAGSGRGRVAPEKPGPVHATPPSHRSNVAMHASVASLLEELPPKSDLLPPPVDLATVPCKARLNRRQKIVRAFRRSPRLWVGVASLFVAVVAAIVLVLVLIMTSPFAGH